jgi:hypothetical protein
MKLLDNCKKCGRYTKLNSIGLCKKCAKKEEEEEKEKRL